MSYQIEICANGIQSAINAEHGGAHRIELCDNLWEGGTTPSQGTIALAKHHLTIPVYVLIRPRGGDFVYSELEFEVIKKDLLAAKEAGADGIVSGVLLPDGTIDVERTKLLVSLTFPLPFTFHRAFDHVVEVEKGLEDLIACGVNRVLTSGQNTTALEGLDEIKNLLSLAAERIIILPGGGITPSNVHKLHELGCREFHFSAKASTSGLANYVQKVSMNGSKDIAEDTIQVSDPSKIREMKRLLDEME